MLRFAITGPESSGKSTLSELIASKINAQLIPEFARAYLLEKNGKYDRFDLDKIALGQIESWNKKQDVAIQVCDTEMLVMKVWSNYKYGMVSDFIQNAFQTQQFDHYFLCRPDIPWEDDPLREHPEEREKLFEIYLSELKSANLPFTIVEGELIQRIEKCQKIISNFF